MKTRAVRIYDTKTKKMVYPKEGTSKGVFIGMDGYPMQFDGEKFFKLDGCIPMYDTGLRAQGGVPIWEGDICEVDVPMDFGGMVSFMKDRGVMVFDEINGKWFLKMRRQPMQHQGAFQVTNAQVIGDIYQHKHLLKNEQND